MSRRPKVVVDNNLVCSKCKQEKSTRDFSPDKKHQSRFKSACKVCCCKEQKIYRENNTASIKKARHERGQMLKRTVIAHYSRGAFVCAYCGFGNMRALSIDHINGKGTTHRRKLGLQGNKFYTWLIQQGFPKGYQVLCMNCQWIKGR